VNGLIFLQDEQLAKADSTEEEAKTSDTAQDAGLPALPNRDINRRVALVSTLGALALFASKRLDLGQASLKDLAANAVPYEEVNTTWPWFSTYTINNKEVNCNVLCI
jgi:hypothetical protein